MVWLVDCEGTSFVCAPIFHSQPFFYDVFTAVACYNISLSLEQTGALSRALQSAREAWHIRLKTLPPGHKHVSDAEKRVRRLEQATR